MPVNADGPSLGEVVRRLDDVSRRLDEVSARLEQRESRFEKTYVRLDVFEAVQATDAVQMRGIEAEVHSLGKRFDALESSRRQDRALVLSGLAFPLLIALVTALLLSGRVS